MSKKVTQILDRFLLKMKVDKIQITKTELLEELLFLQDILLLTLKSLIAELVEDSMTDKEPQTRVLIKVDVHNVDVMKLLTTDNQ